MKNKIRSLVAAFSVAVLTAPVIALAQFDPNAGGGTGLPQASLLSIVQNFMRWLLIIVGIMGVIGFAIAGILYLTSAGDEDRIKSAKSAMIFSIVGVIVALLGLVIMTAAFRFLGAQSGF